MPIPYKYGSIIKKYITMVYDTKYIQIKRLHNLVA